MRKVAVFTGTRADYGLLYWLMKDLQNDPHLELQLLVSGSHLSPEYGQTFRQIEQDGFHITEKAEILISADTPQGVAKSMGLGGILYSDCLERMSPDVIVILGDRFEALAVAQTALIMKIPILHIHGGEITEGAYDDSIRHAITKMSYIHCTTNEEHRNRVIQLGESPGRVFNVGAPGLEHVNRLNLLSKKDLSESIDFTLKNFLLVTYHPVTVGNEEPTTTFSNLLTALNKFEEQQVLITYPNADDGGRSIIPMLERYASRNPNRVIAIKSLGQVRYLSALKYATAVVGNSSSGIIEVPSFNIPTINIGCRQKGRVASKSVINSGIDEIDIEESIRTAIVTAEHYKNKKMPNPYGNGNTAKRIIEIIKNTHFKKIKPFYNLPNVYGETL